MRGQENPQTSMFSYVSLEQRVPKDHPLRALRALVDGILAQGRRTRMSLTALDMPTDA